jgi:lytic murein transglycosylase
MSGAGNGRLRTLVVVLALSLTACLVLPTSAWARKPARQDRAFREFILSLWPLAQERGVSHETFASAFAGVSFDANVVAEAKTQAEFTRPIWDYVGSAVSPERIDRGRGKAREQRPWLSKAHETYGVDGGIVMGIWGLESDFGGATGTDNVIQALASLAYVGFRADYFRDELLAALVILEAGDIKAHEMRGSWAGAMGQTQFMPSSFLIYAVDFERHGKRDIWTSAPDAIGSTANYLAAHGWTKDLPWGFEVQLPAAFALTDADSSRPAPFSSFADRGVRRADGANFPKSGEGRLLIPAGLKGPIFLVTGNFDVIKAYNASTAYALSVGLLGDAISGGGGVVASWPTKDHALNPIEVRSLQAKLVQMGYSVGEIDGMVGDSLRSAVRAYQQRNGIVPDGYADLALLRRVEADNPSGLRGPW